MCLVWNGSRHQKINKTEVGLLEDSGDSAPKTTSMGNDSHAFAYAHHVGRRYCDRCKLDKPPRTHHCSVCNRYSLHRSPPVLSRH